MFKVALNIETPAVTSKGMMVKECDKKYMPNCGRVRWQPTTKTQSVLKTHSSVQEYTAADIEQASEQKQTGRIRR
jgi:hypothetical protein